MATETTEHGRVFASPEEFQRQCLAWQRAGQWVGMVPTMGALHEGHLSLVRRCRQQCDRVVLSIFVNPTQFAPGEDFARYPRDLTADLRAVQGLGVDAVLAPEPAAMYPADFSTAVQPPKLAKLLEGQFRPDHFLGVTTVVAKLLNLARADVAVFGQKDYQQCAVIRQMVADLNLPTQIVMAPTFREPDGLAMSSRNRYLNPEQRLRANGIYRSLTRCRQRVDGGQRDARELAADLLQDLIDGGLDSIDYAVIVDGRTLQSIETVQPAAVALVAGLIGSTRLIDNLVLWESEEALS
jgi:pantoate--beta-alanine ligase